MRTTVIEPAKGWVVPDLKRDIWDQRDLIYFLARRDVALRYRQSIFGVFWTVLQAALLAAVFTIFFGNFAEIPSVPGVPYSLFAVTGMLLWIFFSNAMAESAGSTVASAGVIQKVHFPRLAIPIAAVFPATIDFVVGFVLVLGITLAYGFPLQPQILLMPALLALVMGTALGLGLWFSALNVSFRDIYVVLPFVLLLGLFLSPILYPFDLIKDQAPAFVQPLYGLNPMVGILETYRWIVLGTPFRADLLAMSAGITLLLLVTGVFYFKRAEPRFADVI